MKTLLVLLILMAAGQALADDIGVGGVIRHEQAQRQRQAQQQQQQNPK